MDPDQKARENVDSLLQQAGREARNAIGVNMLVHRASSPAASFSVPRCSIADAREITLQMKTTLDEPN